MQSCSMEDVSDRVRRARSSWVEVLRPGSEAVSAGISYAAWVPRNVSRRRLVDECARGW